MDQAQENILAELDTLDPLARAQVLVPKIEKIKAARNLT